MEPKSIFVKGAREHNLKNIDVKIPRNQLVVITGLSGSGKSSLAFDTIYAEGQRRYVESLSAYARQFLDQMGKPDVDFIEGLSPAISIEQKTASHNPRSTVGTITEIYDYLRLLYARIGRVHCHQCGKAISSQTVSQIVDQILKFPTNAKLHLFAPIVRNRKGEYSKELKELAKQGFVRVKIDGTVYELTEEIKLDKKKKHHIDLMVDRLVLKEGIEKRLADSIETALSFSDGLIKVETLADGEEHLYSTNNACIDCGVSYPVIEPQMFSFNSPMGACVQCDGLGTKNFFDPKLIIPNENLSLREEAILPWSGKFSVHYQNVFKALANHYKFDTKTPFKKLTKKIQEIILHGSKGEQIEFSYDKARGKKFYQAEFEGVIPALDRKYHQSESDWIREDLEKYMNVQPCPECQGARLKKESLSILVGGYSIHEYVQFSVKEALKLTQELFLTKKEKEIATRILKEIGDRLSFLNDVGLDYLSLDRTSSTLSGGEAQRIRLATQIGSALVGVLYILDEPSIGLHQRDNDRLIATLKKLRDLGNTVLVVEHDEDTINTADYVLDIGPRAGVHGGEIVAEGTPAEIKKSAKSLTGKYLSGKKEIKLPQFRKIDWEEKITLKKAKCHNLKEVSVDFPLSRLICVTGVSGSGKSTLINDTLYPALAQHLYGSKVQVGEHQEIIGLEKVDKVINIDQSPIGRTPRSNPATYTGVFTSIRDLFTELPESKSRGYKPGRYSFNVKGGRCEHCQGDGIIRIEMHFLPDVYVECEQCHGKRYNRETLEIKYKGKSIADVLNFTVAEGLEFFQNIPPIKNKLETLVQVGLEYIKLGQQATTLSGGEAQRIKLSRELSKRSTGQTIYILDEPTTGLHFEDIAKLLEVLQKLVDRGNTVLVIEHNLDVIKCADHIIDLGPEGGDKGGQIIATGSPKELSQNSKSYTGRYLKRYFK